MQEQVGQSGPSADRALRDALASRDAVALDAVRPILTVTAALYALFTVTHTLFLPPDVSTPLGLLAAVTAVLLGVGRLLVGRFPPRSSWAHPILVAVAALALSNAIVHLAVSGEPHQTTSVMLVLVACGVFLVNGRWLALVVGLAWGGWGAVAAMHARSHPWAHYGFALLSASVVAVLVHVIRLRSLRRFVEQRDRLEDAIREARQGEERFRKLTEATFEAVIVHRDGRIIDANPSFATLFGYGIDAARGMDVLTVVAPDERERVRERITGTSDEPYETIGMRDDGVRLRLEVRAQTVPWGDGVARVAALRDVAVHKEREGRLAQALAELERSNEELERFAYVVSHDLQAPLRTIASFSEILMEDWHEQLDGEGRQFLDRIVGGVARMRRLLHDLLAYSRVGTSAREYEAVELDRVLDAALEDLAAAIDETGAIIHRAPLPRVVADDAQMEQVLSNLLGNALKFRSATPPVIHVSARPEDGGFVVSVKDNGIGIEPRYCHGIFNVFERLHSAGDYPGTGIGLAICKRIVERHGGRIWVESQPGEGATFHVFLPGRS